MILPVDCFHNGHQDDCSYCRWQQASLRASDLETRVAELNVQVIAWKAEVETQKAFVDKERTHGARQMELRAQDLERLAELEGESKEWERKFYLNRDASEKLIARMQEKIETSRDAQTPCPPTPEGGETGEL